MTTRIARSQHQQPQAHDGGAERFETTRTVHPAVDIFEGANETWIVADLPGVRRDALTVEIENDTLSIEAPHQAFTEGEEAFLYARSFRLPPGLDGSDVQAALEDGVLTLKLPKAAELKPRRITVNAA